MAALTAAISEAEAALAADDATAESLAAASTNLTAAIDGLTLEEGCTSLTKDMFMEWDGPGKDATATQSGYGAYALFTASDLPYGDGNVSEVKYADLSAFGKLVITLASSDVKPRLCINRVEADGQDAATEAASKMLDINSNNADVTWATEKYVTVSEDGRVFTINLAAIVKDQGFAHLHCIKKQGWGAGVTVTDLILLPAPATEELTAKEHLDGYVTFYSKTTGYEVDDNTTVYIATAADADGITIEAQSSPYIPAGEAVILKTTAADGALTLTESDEAAGALEENLLRAATDATAAVYGYVLGYTADQGIAFYRYKDAIPEGAVYLPFFEAEEPAAGAPLRIIVAGEATAIQRVTPSAAASAATYNLSGQRVDGSYRGIVIQNGKKLLVK